MTIVPEFDLDSHPNPLLAMPELVEMLLKCILVSLDVVFGAVLVSAPEALL